MSAEIVVWRPNGWVTLPRTSQALPTSAWPWCARCGRPVESMADGVVDNAVVTTVRCHGMKQDSRMPVSVWRAAERLEVGKAFALAPVPYGFGCEVDPDTFTRGTREGNGNGARLVTVDELRGRIGLSPLGSPHGESLVEDPVHTTDPAVHFRTLWNAVGSDVKGKGGVR